MIRSDYMYAISLYSKDGTALGQVAVDPGDLEPAVEWSRFDGIRCGLLSPEAGPISTTVWPIWHEQVGQPCLSGIRVSVSKNGDQLQRDVPRAYFHPIAQQASAAFVAKGVLKSGETFSYLVLAFACGSDGGQETDRRFRLEVLDAAMPLRESCLGEYTAQAQQVGSAAEDGNMPVTFPQHVMDEVVDQTGKSGTLETGGILIGHVHRDSGIPEIFLEVTAQIPARHTRSEPTQLTFTAETWTDVDSARKLRGKSELMLGWWHCHTYLKETCKDCPKLKDGSCNATATFMSTEDLVLHRTCFPRAYSIALVVAADNTPEERLSWALFGWEQGLLRSRGFYILPERKLTHNANTEEITNAS